MKMRFVLLAAAASVVSAGPAAKLRKIYDKHLQEHDLERPESSYNKGVKGLRRIVPKQGLDFNAWKGLNPDWVDGSAFDQVDKDDDGVIWFQELNAYANFLTEHPNLHYIGRKPRKMDADLTQDVVETMLKAANPRGPGLYATKQQMGEWRAKESFQAYDADGDDRISRKELADVLYNPVTLNRFKRLQNRREQGHHSRKFVKKTEEIRTDHAPFCDFHCPRSQSRLEKEAGKHRKLFGWTQAAETAVGTSCQYMDDKNDCEHANDALSAGMDCAGAVTGDVIAAAKCAYHGITDISAAWNSDYEQNSTITEGHRDDGSCDGKIKIDESPSWYSCGHEGMHTCGSYCCCMVGYHYQGSTCQACWD